MPIDDFCDALVAERNASGNTVRAYRTDAGTGRWAYRRSSMRSMQAIGTCSLYLAQARCGCLIRAGRSAVAFRRCARFRWLNVTGRVDANPAARSSGRKSGKHLPQVLRPRDMARLLSVHASTRFEGRPASRLPICATRHYSEVPLCVQCAHLSRTIGACCC